jgi:site-specific recombinase XerD
VRCVSSVGISGKVRHSPFVFVSERGAPLSASGFSRLVERAAAELGIKAHAHMLRHARGYKLANNGHDTRAIQAYLGHRNIQNTTRYTALAPERFKEFSEIALAPAGIRRAKGKAPPGRTGLLPQRPTTGAGGRFE